MSGVNKAIIVGRLGNDPDGGQTKSGTPTCTLSVATSHKNNGEEITTWHRIKCFGKTAEACMQYLSKGRQVYVEGRMNNGKYTAKDGSERYFSEVVASHVEFLGSKSEAGNSGGQGQGGQWGNQGGGSWGGGQGGNSGGWGGGQQQGGGWGNQGQGEPVPF